MKIWKDKWFDAFHIELSTFDPKKKIQKQLTIIIAFMHWRQTSLWILFFYILFQ